MSVEPSTATTFDTCGAMSSLTCPVPHPRSPTVSAGSISASMRVEMKAIAEQLGAQVIPLARRRREKLFRLRSPLREHALQPPLVLLGAVGAGDLLADQRPQPLRAGIEIRT